LSAADSADLQAIGKQLAAGVAAFEEVASYVAANMKSDIKAVFAGSVPYLKLAGVVLGGWQMARAAAVAAQKLAEGSGDASFYKAKIATARFFAEHILVQAGAYRTSILEGSSGVLALDIEQF
jgi:hypothetical protein